MKKGHYIFEFVITGIMFFIGMLALIAYFSGETNGDIIFIFLIGWLIFGALQVLHSFFILINHIGNRKVLKMIGNYWIGIGINAVILWLSSNLEMEAEWLTTFALIILPAVLALYLCYITYVTRESSADSAASIDA